MTVLDNIDNRMPLDENYLDPHIEEYIRGWVERKVFEKKTIYLFMHSSSFQCDYPMVTVTGASVGVQIRQGVNWCCIYSDPGDWTPTGSREESYQDFNRKNQCD